MTGYQRGVKTHSQLLDTVSTAMEGDQAVHTVVRSLRGAKDIMTKGGHVTFDYREQDFSVAYDNRRMAMSVESSSGRRASFFMRGNTQFDLTEALASGLITKDSEGILRIEYSKGIWVDTEPYEYAEEAALARSINVLTKGHFNKKDRVDLVPSIDKVFELARREFIHAGLEGRLQLVEGSPLLENRETITLAEVDSQVEILGKDSADLEAESIVATNVALPVTMLAKIANVKVSELGGSQILVPGSSELRMQLRIEKHRHKGGFVANSVPKFPGAVSFANYLLQV